MKHTHNVKGNYGLIYTCFNDHTVLKKYNFVKGSRVSRKCQGIKSKATIIIEFRSLFVSGQYENQLACVFHAAM